MNILITGASGKIGLNLSKYLIEKKYFCILNSRKKIKFNQNKIKYLRSSISKKKFNIPKETDIMIHLACDTENVLSKNKSFKKNFINDKKIYNLVKNNKKIKKMIFFSTALVFSNRNNKKVDENNKKFSTLSYVRYKLKSEKLFLKLKKIKVYVLRVPGVLIDKNKDLNFLSTLIKKIRNNQNVILYNKENFFNNLILIKELNRLIVHLIKNKFSSGIILLGVKKPIQLQLIAKKIIKFYKSKTKITWKIKNIGYYLNIKRLVNNYHFNTLSTSVSLREYLKKK